MTPPSSAAVTTLAPNELKSIDAYWRAANYPSVGQMGLGENPLLRRPLASTDAKRMLHAHQGKTPRQNSSQRT